MAGSSAIVLNGRFTLWAATALFSVGQAVAVYCLLQVVSLKTDVAAMRANRWTSKDQAAYMQHHESEHDLLPPDWMRDEIKRQTEEDKRLQVQIDRLEDKVLERLPRE